MKVTLKDIKRHRKSVQQEEYGKTNGDTRESITQDTNKIDSNKYQFSNNQNQHEQVVIRSFEPQPKIQHESDEIICQNHP